MLPSLRFLCRADELYTTFFSATRSMSSKMFSRLRSVMHRSGMQSDAPSYSTVVAQDLASPQYQEQTFSVTVHQARGRPNIQRTTSESSLTSAELSMWVEHVDENQRCGEEELPPYEERPQGRGVLPQSPSSVSVAPSSRSQTQSLCPCAQCHRLR